MVRPGGLVEGQPGLLVSQRGRQLLREVLAGPLRFTPDARTYRFEGEAAMGRVLAGITGRFDRKAIEAKVRGHLTGWHVGLSDRSELLCGDDGVFEQAMAGHAPEFNAYVRAFNAFFNIRPEPTVAIRSELACLQATWSLPRPWPWPIWSASSSVATMLQHLCRISDVKAANSAHGQR